MRIFQVILIALACCWGARLSAHEDHGHDHGDHAHDHGDATDAWSIGGILYPNLHFHSIMGASSRPRYLGAAGGHDPSRQALSAQAIEPAVSLRTEYLEGFASYLMHQGSHGDWDGDLESAFLTVPRLPGGIALTAGQFLADFGSVNQLHLHDRDFVDFELSSGAFLGDHGLLLRGGEVAWDLPVAADSRWHPRLTISHGSMRPDSHHAHEHQGHSGTHALHENEDSMLDRKVWVARVSSRVRIDDQRSLVGGYSFAYGDNGFERLSQIHALDMEWRWRDDREAPRTRSLRWKNELTWRQVEAFSAHDDDEDGVIDAVYRGRYQEWGMFSQAVVSWSSQWDTALRVGWLQGIRDFDQAERLRVSPAVTWWLGTERRVAMRAQYNCDLISGEPDRHALWLQLNVALGSRLEIR